jgi:hypothetical protein
MLPLQVCSAAGSGKLEAGSWKLAAESEEAF